MEFLSTIATFTLITVVAVTGVFALTGLTGMFSLGQASFMAIGAYVSGLLFIKLHMPFTLAAIAAVLVGTGVGYIVGYPTVRLRRDYISLITLGFGEAIAALLNQMVNLTGGAMGLSGIPKKTTFLVAFLSAVICIAIVAGYKNSKFGRQAIALRSDELAAKAMGINTTKIKMITFLIATAITCYAGVLYGAYTTYVDPTMFDWAKSAEWVIMVFFGGVNSLTGSIVAAVILTGLPEVLRFASALRITLYAVLVILILNFKPNGLFGEYELTIKSIKRLFAGKERKGNNESAANR